MLGRILKIGSYGLVETHFTRKLKVDFAILLQLQCQLRRILLRPVKCTWQVVYVSVHFQHHGVDGCRTLWLDQDGTLKAHITRRVLQAPILALFSVIIWVRSYQKV